jgi:serine/threonine protein kinase
VLAGFSHVRALGTGGFADVFLFEQDMPRRPVAVKVMLRDVVDADLLRMFRAEADVMARLSAHPSIITIYEASVSSDGRPYIAMEYCPGSLTNRYRREQIPIHEVLVIGVKMASALQTAHDVGLLHRDIKPSNILTTQFGAPVLSDFGIASVVTQSRLSGEVVAMSLPWSAPEVVAEVSPGSIASEVWSLGATLYTLLAGHSPFEATGAGQNTRAKVCDRISKAHYTPITRVPDNLQGVLATSMRRDAGDRFADAANFGQALQRVQIELGLPFTPLEVPQDEWSVMTTAQADPYTTAPWGPVRSRVAYTSARPVRVAAPIQTRDGLRDTGPRRRWRKKFQA